MADGSIEAIRSYQTPEARALTQIEMRARRLRRLLAMPNTETIQPASRRLLSEAIRAWDMEVAYPSIERPAGDQTRRAAHIRQAPEGIDRGGCAVSPISENEA